MQRCFGIEYQPTEAEKNAKTPELVLDDVIELCKQKYEKLESVIPDADFRQIERRVLLMTIDQHWKEHLYAMDQLKDAIRFQGYAQKDPLIMYKSEGFKTFESCLESIAIFTSMRILNIRIQLADGTSVSPEQIPQVPKPQAPTQLQENTSQIKGDDAPPSKQIASSALPGTRPQRSVPRKTTPVKNDTPKLGRNDLCWCGSGLKFKKCHGKDAE